MKLIQKSREPNYLLEHRGLRGTDYESFKRDIGLGDISPASGLRRSLLVEQGYICAYCMRRIPHRHSENGITSDKMKVEHFIAQTKEISINQKLDIKYINIFACCMGNSGKEEEFETCDTRKGEDDIIINPLILAHIQTLNYAPDGSIHSTNSIFENDIDRTLNLNEDNLKQQRAAIYTLIEKRVKATFKKPFTRREKNEFLDKQIRFWNTLNAGKYEQFCMVAITYLEKRKR